MNPLSGVSGLRSSWDTVATKFALSCSRSTSSVTSRTVITLPDSAPDRSRSGARRHRIHRSAPSERTNRIVPSSGGRGTSPPAGTDGSPAPNTSFQVWPTASAADRPVRSSMAGFHETIRSEGDRTNTPSGACAITLAMPVRSSRISEYSRWFTRRRRTCEARASSSERSDSRRGPCRYTARTPRTSPGPPTTATYGDSPSRTRTYVCGCRAPFPGPTTSDSLPSSWWMVTFSPRTTTSSAA